MYNRNQIIKNVMASTITNVVMQEVPAKWQGLFVSTDQCGRNDAGKCYEIKTRDNLIWADKNQFNNEWQLHLYHPEWETTESADHETMFKAPTLEKAVAKAQAFAKKNSWPLPQGLS